MHKKPVSLALCCLALVALTLPSVSFAAEAPAPLVEMWVVKAKEGQGQELMDGIKANLALRAEKGDPWTWQVYTPVLGEDLGRIAIRSCCFNWGDLDAYEKWNADHPELNEHFRKNLAPHVQEAAHYFEEMDWANSHWKQDGGPYRYFAVTEWVIKPGQEGAFNEARSKASQIAINQGWGGGARSWLWGTRLGGIPRAFIVVPHANYASMQPGGESFLDFLTAQMGSRQAAADLLQQFSSSTEGSDFQIWELRDLGN